MATEYVKTVECPKCRFRNVAGTKFCGDCGTALDSGVPLNCDKCGAVNPPSQKFCGTCGNSLIANADTDPDIRHLQEALKERYVILKSLGEGGFGRVFLAEHTGLKQKHVIKVLSADSSRSTDIRNRFFQEAQAIARLKHPNIVPIMDVSESGGRPYYIMSYLEGGSLEEFLLKEKKLSVETALGLVSKLLSALSEVHKKGIIHRDIKPSNVILDEMGEPILIDFGIARVEESTGSKTKTGISIGTPQYMSPEQLDAKPINLTTDIYSMGILLFELLTGKPPFEGSISSLITQHNTVRLPSVSGKIGNSKLVDVIQTVLQKACAKEPSARYGSAKEMREAVEGILKIKGVVPESIKISDTQKEEKSGTLPTQEIQLEKITTKEEFPQKEVVIEQTYQDKPLKIQSSFQNKTTIIGIVMGLVIVLLGGYFLMSKMGQPEKNRTNTIGIEFALIPSGSFQMGCSDGDENCQDDEKPQHKVTISNSYYMGKYEVTQGQWKRVVGNNPSFFKNCGDDCPVEQVSWNDVQEFIRKLCEVEKMSPCKYRLPTEAEWEYAARAGSKSRIYMGDMKILGKHNSPELDGIAWYSGNSGVSYGGGFDCSEWSEKQYSSLECGTHPVGQRKPNAWGLYDMIGNVSEWNDDWYDEKYYNKEYQTDPKNAEPGLLMWRVLRGGSWGSHTWYSRLSTRGYNNPALRSDGSGFRLVLLP